MVKRVLFAACLVVCSSSASAQQAQSTITLRTTVDKPCVAFTTDFDTAIVVETQVLTDLAQRKAGVAGLDNLDPELAGSRARSLLALVGAQEDFLGCQLSTHAIDDIESEYLLAALIKIGRVAIYSGSGRDRHLETTANYSEVHCSDRNPAGHVSVDVAGGPVLMMLPTCIV